MRPNDQIRPDPSLGGSGFPLLLAGSGRIRVTEAGRLLVLEPGAPPRELGPEDVTPTQWRRAA